MRSGSGVNTIQRGPSALAPTPFSTAINRLVTAQTGEQADAAFAAAAAAIPAQNPQDVDLAAVDAGVDHLRELMDEVGESTDPRLVVALGDKHDLLHRLIIQKAPISASRLVVFSAMGRKLPPLKEAAIARSMDKMRAALSDYQATLAAADIEAKEAVDSAAVAPYYVAQQAAAQAATERSPAEVASAITNAATRAEVEALAKDGLPAASGSMPELEQAVLALNADADKLKPGGADAAAAGVVGSKAAAIETIAGPHLSQASRLFLTRVKRKAAAAGGLAPASMAAVQPAPAAVAVPAPAVQAPAAAALIPDITDVREDPRYAGLSVGDRFKASAVFKELSYLKREHARAIDYGDDKKTGRKPVAWHHLARAAGTVVLGLLVAFGITLLDFNIVSSFMMSFGANVFGQVTPHWADLALLTGLQTVIGAVAYHYGSDQRMKMRLFMSYGPMLMMAGIGAAAGYHHSLVGGGVVAAVAQNLPDFLAFLGPILAGPTIMMLSTSLFMTLAVLTAGIAGHRAFQAAWENLPLLSGRLRVTPAVEELDAKIAAAADKYEKIMSRSSANQP